MNLDIILYAIIAVVLLARLWTVFGRRNHDEKQRPNPFVMPAPGPQDGKKTAISSDPRASAETPLLLQSSAAPASLAGGLEQIKALDPSFDEKAFLQGARSAFTTVVEDFAKGDLDRIGRLLGPAVLPHFQAAIEARRKAGQVMESRVTRIRDAETAAASTDNVRSVITVRFVSEQENVLRDMRGQVVGGEAGKIEEVTDLWTFARDIKSSDPNWILIETHS
jgi:predicted lipid-binding transport protein (Tim44 family)